MSILKTLRKWVTGKSDEDDKKKKRDALRVTNYGGGAARNDTKGEVKRSIQKAEKAKTQATKSSSAFKATPPSVKKAEAKDKQTKPTQSAAFKASTFAPKRQSTALGTVSEKEAKARTAKKNAFEANRKEKVRAAESLKPLLDEKYSTRKSGAPTYVKQGNYAADPDVAKYNVLKHPYATSATRGAVSGTTFGLSELAISKLSKGEAKEAEKFYQANKSKGAETLGELGGSLISFGGTSPMTDKLGGKVVGKLAPNAAKKLAEKQFIKNAAGRLVERGVETNVIGGATEELVKQVGKDKAKKIVGALGNDIVQNLTTGALYDVNKASAQYEVGSKEWWKELGKSALFNFVVTGGIAGKTAITGGRQLVENAADTVAKRAEVRSALRPVGNVEPKRSLPRIGESIEDRIARIDADNAVKRYPAVEDEYLDYDGTIEAVNRYYDPDATAEAAVDRYYDLDASQVRPKVTLNRKRKTDLILPNEKPKTEPPIARDKAPLTEETDALKAYEESKKRTYTVEVTSKKGKTRKVTVEAKSEAEALDEAYKKKNVKTAKNATLAETAEEKQARMMREADEKNDAIRSALAGEEPTTAKGVKPAAENLNAKAQTESKNIENLGDVVGKKRKKTTFRENFHKVKASVKTAISDSLNAFEEANKQFIRSDHNKWLANNAAIDKTRRSGAIAGRSIGEGQVNWKGDKITGSHEVVINGKKHTIEDGKSLKQIYDGLDKTTENEFEQYLLLKHAPSRIEADKPIFAGSQYNTKEACEAAAKELLDKHPDFAVRAEELYQYTRNEMQNRVDAGLIKQEIVDEWREKYPFYVPTGRDGDFSGEKDIWDLVGQLKNEGNTVGAGEIKKASGGDQPIRSIKEQLAEATNRNWRDMTLNNLFRNMFGDEIGKELAVYADGGLEEVLDHTINLRQSKDGGKYFAEVFENGEKHRVEIEKSFYDSLNDLYKNGRFGDGHGGLGDGLDLLNDAASIPSGYFKKVVTSWNPIFMVKNGLRDFPEAIINSRQTKEFLQVMHSGQALAELSNGGEFLQALRDSGVSQANLVNLEEALTKGDNILKKGVNKFVALQEAVETYPRLIEYMATIKKMMPAGYELKNGLKDVPMEIRDIAAANAADVTVNFGRSGSVGKALNRGLVPFFNPSVQGWSKFIRNFSEQKSVKSLLSVILKAGALGAGATAINNYFLKDNPNYQRISARDKATNYIIPVASYDWDDSNDEFDTVPLLPLKKNININNTDTFIKIPKSRFAAEYSLPAVNAFNENKMGYAEMMKVSKDQVFVVDPSRNNILSPLLDTMKSPEGETWYGTPIVPQALVDLPKSEQTDVNTSNISTAIGKASAKVQKKLHLPEEAQISPKKLDYIIDSETGVFGDFALPMSTPSKQGSGNAVDKYVKYPAGNVLKKSFTIDSVTQNDLSTRFYDQMGKAETKSKSSEAGKAESDEYKRYNGFSTEVSKVNKAIKALQGSKRETKLEDVRGMQKVRNQLMQDAIDGKDAPSSNTTMNAVQKYVGTTYAIKNFGKEVDRTAMEKYGEKKYGDISNKEMRKAIDADKGFFKGVKAIGNLEARIEKAGTTSNTALTKAVALAGAKADDDLFGAYGAVSKSRTESANKMTRARNYFDEGGSEKEYTKLEVARRTLGKLSADDEAEELDKLKEQFKKGELSWEERDNREKSIKYNANLSYIGLAASLAQVNAPERGYRLYDIKDKNIQKGINLAAMGFTARDYKEMSKALDTNGNGYPSKQEIIDYVNKNGVKDKATLFDALYYYQGKSNPFGTPTNYTREQAAAMGKQRGLKSIGDDTSEFKLNPESTSGSGNGYYRRGYRRWRRWGRRGGSGKAPAHSTSGFKAKKASSPKPKRVSAPKTNVSTKSNVSVKSSVGTSKSKIKTGSIASAISNSGSRRGSSANYNTASVKYNTASAVKKPSAKKKTTAKVTPPKVKFKKYEV